MQLTFKVDVPNCQITIVLVNRHETYCSQSDLLERPVQDCFENSFVYVRLYLRKGKMVGAGEIQIVHLQAQPSILDPVAAVERLI